MRSLDLASPVWLAGLLALLLPLLLHLLARGRGRRVQVGSVRLLSGTPPRRPRRLQLQRPWLLALRCLLLAALVLALAGPRLRREAGPSGTPHTWVLLDPEAAARWRSERNRPNLPRAVRGAIEDGAEVRLLAPGLPRLDEVAAPEELPHPATIPGGSWSLLREAAAAAPPGTPLQVVTVGRLAALRGERPAIGNAVSWHELDEERSNRWVERVLAPARDPMLLVGESDRRRTTFHGEPLSPTPRGVARIPPGDAVAGDDALPWAAARPLRVIVLASSERGADAAYLRAALEAAAESAGVELELVGGSRTGAAAGVPTLAGAPVGAPALVFWLADAPPPPPLLAAARQGAVLVSDAGKLGERCEGSWTVGPAVTTVSLHRCAATTNQGDGERVSPDARTVVLWRTDNGRAVLTVEPLGEGRWLRFGGRFHPAWSELVLSPAFPEWLRGLLLARTGARSAELPISDLRSAAGQGAPAPAPRRSDNPLVLPPSRLPELSLLLLLFPLFLAERLLATRR